MPVESTQKKTEASEPAASATTTPDTLDAQSWLWDAWDVESSTTKGKSETKPKTGTTDSASPSDDALLGGLRQALEKAHQQISAVRMKKSAQPENKSRSMLDSINAFIEQTVDEVYQTTGTVPPKEKAKTSWLLFQSQEVRDELDGKDETTPSQPTPEESDWANLLFHKAREETEKAVKDTTQQDLVRGQIEIVRQQMSEIFSSKKKTSKKSRGNITAMVEDLVRKTTQMADDLVETDGEEPKQKAGSGSWLLETWGALESETKSTPRS